MLNLSPAELASETVKLGGVYSSRRPRSKLISSKVFHAGKLVVSSGQQKICLCHFKFVISLVLSPNPKFHSQDIECGFVSMGKLVDTDANDK